MHFVWATLQKTGSTCAVPLINFHTEKGKEWLVYQCGNVKDRSNPIIIHSNLL